MSLSEKKRQQLIAQRNRNPSLPRPLFLQRREPRDKLRERMTAEHPELLLAIESTLLSFDAQVRPIDGRICREALSFARRGRTQVPGDAGLLAALLESARTCMETTDVLWNDALQTVEDSVQNHSTYLPGERSYLDFVRGFIEDAHR